MNKNFFKVVVWASISFIAISCSYYFFIFLPWEKNLSKQIECFEKGKIEWNVLENKRIQKEIEWEKEWQDAKTKQDYDFITNFLVYDLSKPEYFFSKKFNSCLIKIGLSRPSSFENEYKPIWFQSCSIKDIYSNKILAEYKINNFGTDMWEEKKTEYENFLKIEKNLIGTGDCVF